LLLEGDDLEALLARARAEGGPEARIVRAEKIRHGGILGFFAKERFQVALEIVDGSTAPAPQEEPMSQPPSAEPGATPRGGAEGALDRFTRRMTAAADDPAVAAREGLLGLADRADAAERAAAPMMAAHVPARAPDALDDALRKLLEPQPAEALAPAADPGAQLSGQPSTSRPEFTALLDQLLEPTRPGATGGPGLPAQRLPEPYPVPPAHPAPAASASGPGSTGPGSTGATTGAIGPAGPAGYAGYAAATGGHVPSAYREVSLPPAAAFAPAPPAPAPAPAPAPPAAPVERHTLGRTTPGGTGTPTRDRREDPQLAADRRALRVLGVPPAWTRQLRPGDRFGAVLRMLECMPEVDIDPATRVVAVVGPAGSVLLEAHRTALDLPTETPAGPVPRRVVVVPGAAGAERAAALTEARLIGDVVVAVEADLAADAGAVAHAVEALQAVGAGAVIAVLAADASLERAQASLDALGQVDALAVEGAGTSAQPAAALQLGLPVVRLDGIPVDRYTWSAVLCAQLGPVPAR
jgi:hypothetical protein